MTPEVTAHLLQSTLFAVAAGLLTLAFRANRAKVRYWLWLSASLKFLLPFALLIGLGGRLGLAPGAHRIASKIATPAVSLAAEYAVQPFSEALSIASSAPRSHDGELVAIPGLWACGFLLVILMRVRLWRRVRTMVHASAPLEIAAKGVKVETRMSPGMLEPGVVGVLRPVLLLPDGIVNRLTAAQLETVIAHELCHVRRRDNLFASLHMVVEALFWFHPLVWWIGARLVEERERACDEEVLNMGNEPRVYADAILDVCKLYGESPLACVSGVTGSDIKRRIEAIMMNRRLPGLSRAKKWLLAVTGLAALAGPIATGVVIGVGHAPVAQAQSARPAPVPVPAVLEQPPLHLPSGAASADVPQPQNAPRERRLVSMLFDLAGLPADEQSRLKQGGVDWVRNSRASGDVVSVIAVQGGKTSVLQDFTADAVVLEAAILKASGSAEMPDAAVTLYSIEHLAQMQKGFPEKKVMLYFGANFSSGAAGTEALANAVNAAKEANMAIFPMFAGGAVQQAGAAGSVGGRGGQAPVLPGVSQAEYDRRTAYAQANFGTSPGGRGGVNPMARTYIAYGPPDRIDDHTSDAQNPSTIWRYNYLDNFHSSVEFEFAQTRGGSVSKRINYPPPLATVTWPEVIDDETEALANALRQDLPRRAGPVPAKTFDNLPAVQVSVLTYPAGEPTSYSVSTDSLSGSVDILVQVTSSAGRVVGTLFDNFMAGPVAHQASFTLPADSYVLRLVLCEEATGRMFGKAIAFDVK